MEFDFLHTEKRPSETHFFDQKRIQNPAWATAQVEETAGERLLQLYQGSTLSVYDGSLPLFHKKPKVFPSGNRPYIHTENCRNIPSI